MAVLAGVDPVTEAAEFGRDILSRARWARVHNGGHPSAAWSSGEQLAVAVVLGDSGHLADRGYTVAQAVDRVAGGLYFPPADPHVWLADLRGCLDGADTAPAPAAGEVVAPARADSAPTDLTVGQATGRADTDAAGHDTAGHDTAGPAGGGRVDDEAVERTAWAERVAVQARAVAEHLRAGRIAAAAEAMQPLERDVLLRNRQINHLYATRVQPPDTAAVDAAEDDRIDGADAGDSRVDGAGSDHAGTGTAGLPDSVAPAWVDGYLTGHDRGEAEGREAGYADYDRHLRSGIAGMLAGDPAVTDYREGVRRHEKSVAAKQSRDAWDHANRLPAVEDATAGHATDVHTDTDTDGWEL